MAPRKARSEGPPPATPVGKALRKPKTALSEKSHKVHIGHIVCRRDLWGRAQPLILPAHEALTATSPAHAPATPPPSHTPSSGYISHVFSPPDYDVPARRGLWRELHTAHTIDN